MKPDKITLANHIMVPKGTRLEIEGEHLVVIAQIQDDTLVVRRLRWYERISVTVILLWAFLAVMNGIATYGNMVHGDLFWSMASYVMTWVAISNVVREVIKK